MKKISKIFVMLLAVVTVFISALPLTVNAAATTISFSKKTVSVGDSVTVTVRVTQKALWGVDMTVNYDEQVLTSPSGSSVTGGAGVLKIVWDTAESVSSKSFAITFKAKKAGNCTISVPNIGASAGNPSQLINIPGASATVTVKDATKSANASLKSLTVSAGSLSPVFSPSKTSYTVNVKKTVTKCTVSVTTADPEATVAITGSSALKIGENKRVITVTAPSGNTKKYTVTINRSDKDEEPKENTNSALETIIDGVSYAVLSDISSIPLPEGFNVSQMLYNGEDVSVASDANGNYRLFYLKSADSDTPVPYTYDEVANTFTRVYMINQMNKVYIVSALPEDFTVSEDYYTTKIQIGTDQIGCYASVKKEFKDMFYLYCFYNGEFAPYRYDSVQGVLQRSPEFGLSLAEAKPAVAEGSFFDRFNSLTANAKTIVVCIFIVIVGVIVLIILLIIKLATRNRREDFDDDDFDDFDSVQFDDNFQLISDDEDNE